MTVKNTEIIKKIIRANFDKSAVIYEQFEQEYGLFEKLTKKLATVSHIQENMNVCDVGCGTGTSSFVLQKIVGSDGKVFGVDSSEKMLEIARAKIAASSDRTPKVTFICADADEFNKNIDIKMDSVQYNATIFIIPEPEKTLNRAHAVLTKNGIVGMNYLLGLYSVDSETTSSEGTSNDLLLLAKQTDKPFAPYGRQVMDTKKIPGILADIGFTAIEMGKLAIEMGKDMMKAFYSIPAQSAGLWPKNSYEERLEKLEMLVTFFEENNINRFYQHWGWCTARVSLNIEEK